MIKAAHSSHPSMGTRISDAAGEALDATTQAIDSSRQFATEAAGKVGEAARDLRDTASSAVRTGAEAVTDATAATQRQLGRYAAATRGYVAREPWKSALIAAAIGAAAAMVVMAMVRNRRDTD